MGRDAIQGFLNRFAEERGVPTGPLDGNGQAQIARGSATVSVRVLDAHGILIVLSRIAEVPAEGREAFYRRLLEASLFQTSDAAFAIDGSSESVYVRALRRLEGLDYEEFEDLVHTVATVADEWDDRLKG
jgi:Tir chaperone protein (CesT) family